MPSNTIVASESPYAWAVAGENLELLLFKLGGKCFALPLEQVRHIAPIASGFLSHGDRVEQHFVFEGQPLTYVALWDRLGLISEFAEYEELHAMLPLRRQDHLDWMAALETSLREGLPFGKARNPRECAFGKWYYSHTFNDRRLMLLLGQFEAPHAHIHALADQLLSLAEGGGTAEALRIFDNEKHTTLAKLLDLFDAADSLVGDLQRRIAIIVNEGAAICALGADGVRDIVSVPHERLTLHGAGGMSAVCGLVILENQEVVPILDWHRFEGAFPGMGKPGG